MPCFHGLAVSIHTPEGPLPEYSIQKQARQHRITSYIAVPAARVPSNSITKKPEQSTFAISITLLTPGLNVPYSTPKPTPEDHYPRPKVVGGLPGQGGKYGSVIGPYVPLTSSPNETIAAYIYFDGRVKEEVATLLRRGEETWVNSRWVSLSEAEGGGLAEREFLFREVGLERWLNGLDLEGKDAAATIQKRRQRLEMKTRRKREAKEVKMESDNEGQDSGRRGSRNGVLRYGEDKNAPLESLSGDENLFTSDSESEDDPPMPEAAGQIKVALFRVLASGEIKRGEYSPQFKAHDNDEEGGNEDGDGDVDHTTSFAQPKTLDPKSISTQTVTGIDPPDKPYAVFTFLYRGEKQLQKMGILARPDHETEPPTTKRASRQLNFSNLKPLDSKTGTKGFAGYRDAAVSQKERKKAFGKKGADDMDSDADDDDERQKPDNDDVDDATNGRVATGEGSEEQGEVAEAIRKMKLKRQASGEALDLTRKQSDSNEPSAAGSPSPGVNSGVGLDSAISMSAGAAGGLTESVKKVPSLATDLPADASIGSPFKKHRASLPAVEGSIGGLNAQLMGARSATAKLQAETGDSNASPASDIIK